MQAESQGDGSLSLQGEPQKEAVTSFCPAWPATQTRQSWGMQGGWSLTSYNCLQPNKCAAWPWMAPSHGPEKWAGMRQPKFGGGELGF